MLIYQEAKVATGSPRRKKTGGKVREMSTHTERKKTTDEEEEEDEQGEKGK